MTMSMSMDYYPGRSGCSSRSPLHETIDNVPSAEMLKKENVKKRHRHVSFGKATVVGMVENRDLLSKKEYEKRWWLENDFMTIKNKCREEVDQIKQSKNANIFSYRGMEMVDPETVVQRQRRYTNCMAAVLIEQREQKSKSTSIPKAIRKVCKKVTIDSVKEALENAYIDRKAIEEYMNRTEEDLEEEYSAQKLHEESFKIKFGRLFRSKAKIRGKDSPDESSVGSSSSSFIAFAPRTTQ